MPLITFTFTVNPETQEAVFAGNIDPTQALHILQDLVIAEMMKRVKEQKEKEEHERTDKVDNPSNL